MAMGSPSDGNLPDVKRWSSIVFKQLHWSVCIVELGVEVNTTGLLFKTILLVIVPLGFCDHPVIAQSAADRGYVYLTEKPYVPPDFDDQAFDEVWKVWPEPLRSKAANASREQRREMAFQRYGLTRRPNDSSHKPLQYVVDQDGNWSINCLACHGGTVRGKVWPGRPNVNFALELLTHEIRATKIRLGKQLAHMDIGSLFMPLGETRGTSNAVMFGVALMAYRDAKLNILPDRLPPRMTHHDMDAPPWWHFKKKPMLYIDGFAQKGARALMQFMLVKENGPEQFHEWESDFQDVFRYIESLEPPTYPFSVHREQAVRGKAIFNQQCAECHGTYGKREIYPNRMVPIDELGTDPVRLRALSVKNREAYSRSWFAHYGRHEVIADPVGYVAPPLDGIWASAPYFHNGSVPTLWHVMHPKQRPVVWKRAEDTRADDYDQQRVGLRIQVLGEVPKGLDFHVARREYFDTRRHGKSAAGHDFPGELSESEKAAVLEYLKTL